MSQAYERTIDRRKFLEQFVNVVEKWECDLQTELDNDQAMATFFNECKMEEPMTGREGEDLA